MPAFSFARAVFEVWGVEVLDIPTSDLEQKKEADFIARIGSHNVLIEEKTKEDDPNYLAERAAELDTGTIHAATLPITRNETLSGIVRNAVRQLSSSSDRPHDFRLLWFTATGVHAQGLYEQFMATLYGKTNIIEMHSAGMRRCYYFRNADFYRRAAILDGAVAAYSDGNLVTTRLCLNSLSPRYHALRNSDIVSIFETGVEDPVKLESEGSAFIVDSDVDRKQEHLVLSYLKSKYGTAPLMKMDLGYTNASIRVLRDEA